MIFKQLNEELYTIFLPELNCIIGYNLTKEEVLEYYLEDYRGKKHFTYTNDNEEELIKNIEYNMENPHAKLYLFKLFEDKYISFENYIGLLNEMLTWKKNYISIDNLNFLFDYIYDLKGNPYGSFLIQKLKDSGFMYFAINQSNAICSVLKEDLINIKNELSEGFKFFKFKRKDA